MRLHAVGLLLPLWSVFAFFACSTSPTSSASSSTGTTGTANCDDLWFVDGLDGGDPCDVCMRDKCCAELAACGTEHCLLCSTYAGVCCDGCSDVDPQWRITRRCAGEKCQPTCFPTCFPPHCPDGGDGG
jgi:hypothetical protein